MRTRYNSQSQNIKTLAMKDCLLHNELNGTPSLDFGFKNKMVQKYRQVE
jgi:hypothetical protein